jgi:sugar lactone lactonase YvrE
MTNDHPMKTITALGICLLIAVSASAQIPNFPTADLVLGQSGFTTDLKPDPPTISSMNTVNGVAVDPATRKVYVADSANNRVLRFANAASLASGAAAEAVLGQANFVSNDANQGGAFPAAGTLSNPTYVFCDTAGRLWVSDAGNHRILLFKNAATLSSNAPANVVFGQPDFVTSSSGLTADKMSNPIRAWLDQNDHLWVADSSNSRVLRFDNAPLTSNGASASGVLGQPDFTTSTSGTTAATMTTSAAVTVDSSGRLWVADLGNNRVLRFDNAAFKTNGAAADAVLGQTNFTTGAAGADASKFNGPLGLFAENTGALWVADALNNRLLRFDNAAAKLDGSPANGVVGQPNFTITASGTSARNLSAPTALWIDPAGALWIAENANSRVLRFSPDIPDTTRPIVKVIGKKKIITAKARLKIKGTASDASGIKEVRYKAGKGGFKKARGTAKWNFIAKLKPGKNIIRIVATDTAGNDSKPLKVRVNRTAP